MNETEDIVLIKTFIGSIASVTSASIEALPLHHILRRRKRKGEIIAEIKTCSRGLSLNR